MKVEALLKVSGVKQAHAITGPYDVFAVAEARGGVEELGKIVISQIQATKGVTDTLLRRREPPSIVGVDRPVRAQLHAVPPQRVDGLEEQADPLRLQLAVLVEVGQQEIAPLRGGDFRYQ